MALLAFADDEHSSYEFYHDANSRGLHRGITPAGFPVVAPSARLLVLLVVELPLYAIPQR
jgi:hypothetical protein